MAWTKLGSTTRASAGAMSLTDLTSKTFNQTMIHQIHNSQVLNYRIDNISTTTYAERLSDNGQTDTTNTSQTELDTATSATNDEFCVMYGFNEATEEKLFISFIGGANTAGATNAPRRREFVGKQTGTTNAYTRVDTVNSANTDSNMSIIGTEGTEQTLDKELLYTVRQDGVGGWVELGRTTLGGTSDTISVTSLSDKRYYMYLMSLPLSGRVDHYHRLNGDTGTNYAYRRSIDGASDVTGTSVTGLLYGSQTVGDMAFNMGYISNLSANEKLVIHQHVDNQAGTGAVNAPRRIEGVGKHDQTSNPVTGLLTYNGDTGDYSSGAEVVVLGWDESDTHTNNFWEELYSDSQTGQTVDNIDSGTFTNKKYLWVQGWFKGTANTTVKMTFNNSTDSTYAYRYSNNGGSDATGTSSANVVLHNTKANATKFLNMFIVNDGSNEILGIAHMVEDGGSGAASDPDRRETVFKRSTTTAITDIEFDNDDTGDFTDWEFKIWGAD